MTHSHFNVNYNFQQATEYINNIRSEGVLYDLAENNTPFHPSALTCEVKAPLIDPKSSIDETINNDLTLKSTSSATMSATTDAKKKILKSAKLDAKMINPLAIPTTSNTKGESYSIKRARLDDGAINKDWYALMEKTIGDLTDIMSGMKEDKAKSLDYVDQLEQEIQRLKEENRLLKENDVKMKELEEENIQLRARAKICGDCGQPVNLILFCSASCQDNDYRYIDFIV